MLQAQGHSLINLIMLRVLKLWNPFVCSLLTSKPSQHSLQGGVRGLNLFPMFKLMIFPLKDIHQPFGFIDDEANEDEAIEHHSELAKPA